MRRAAPLALLLALGLAGGGWPGRAGADLVYVLNSGDASISVLDSRRREEVRRIPVLREAHHLQPTPDRAELVVGDSGGNELLFLDPAAAEVKRRERFSNPYHLEYSPDGRYLVVTSLRRDQVDIYDAATLILLRRLGARDKPSHLAFSPDSRTVWVTLQGTRGLMAIDLEERRPLWTVEVGPQPAGVIWHRGRLLVGVMGSDHIAVVNPADGRVERTIFVGRGAHTVFPSPDGRALYATTRVDSRISVLDPEALQVTARWNIPGGPDCIAFDGEGRLWATLRWVARVAVVDPRTGASETIPVGRSPHGIFVQPERWDPPPRVAGPPLPVLPAAPVLPVQAVPLQAAPVQVSPVQAAPLQAPPVGAPSAAMAEPPPLAAGVQPAADHPQPDRPRPFWRWLLGR